MEDPDTARGTFVHWVVWGIDPGAGSLPEQVVPAGVQQGANGTGGQGYLGPCPPPGGGAHHYRFTLYAVDAPIELSPGASADDLRAAVRGHVVSRARLVGLYVRGTG
jgi:Raf kinase inhibitor-like YbhB/YbcL family protein